MVTTVRAFLLLGSNLGDRPDFLEKGRTLIKKRIGKVVAISSIYQTAAWGNTKQAAFLNQVIGVETKLLPEALLKAAQEIELLQGRTQTEKWGPRTLDIDILFYGDQVIKTPDLIIPHPEIANRRFTLEPLMEVEPDLVHPVLSKSIRKLLATCKDELPVEIYR
ncbi:MAG TPA: 2-amino-4-hydroxy-6-hydroxymethyldihydropteridine diphosphokinase [Cyclobacteriaceae bacterium]|nr:2-amino-4-hydroxy-6-hydroxymethyldihydropteridine diphosphokinase [Cyclobacteriaceae bacterium]